MSTAGERKAGYPTSHGQGDVPASYGLSHSELEQLRKDQKQGKQKMLPAIPGRKGQSPDDPYMVPAVEFLHFYHVELETPFYDSSSGERKDRGASCFTRTEPDH